ncbi:MAG: sensor histidine kinase [Methylococcaceae bacterium]|nr:sensor histidine kinase [Methylococcaceae bacterium]
MYPKKHKQPKVANPSLKTKLLLQLAVPLLFFMLVESVMSYFVTLHYVNDAYDGWLLDSARSLAQEVKLQNGKVVVELPPAALEIFKWDDEDKTYFKVISESDKLIAGDAKVPDPRHIAPAPTLTFWQKLGKLRGDPPALDWSKPIFLNHALYGEPIRVVTMLLTLPQSPEKLYVAVAETEHKRRRMMLDILLADLLPQTLLLLFVGVYLLTGVKRGLQPLHNLTNEIAKRSPRDLHPIPDTHIVKEVQTLIHTINDLFGRLSLAIATQERFIANAAHQLRTPLAGLKLQAERALREQDINAMQPALVHIQNSADRLSHLTSQLLVLARTEPNQHTYELRPLALDIFTREICMDWVPKALERKMELNFACPETPTMIMADALLLRELLVNLLDNAIAYGVEKGTVTVNILNHPQPQLTIMDDGVGIAVTEMDKVFERFYRVPGSSGNGCGLGLAIVKEIADLHGAELRLNRLNTGGGTQIEVIFTATR